MVRTKMMGAVVLSTVFASADVGAQTAASSVARTSTAMLRPAVVDRWPAQSPKVSDAVPDEERYRSVLDAALANLRARRFQWAAEDLEGALRTFPTLAGQDPEIFCGLGDSRYGQMGSSGDDAQWLRFLRLAADAYWPCIKVLQVSGGDALRLIAIKARRRDLLAELEYRRQKLATQRQ